jgi:hypothetical protein
MTQKQLLYLALGVCAVAFLTVGCARVKTAGVAPSGTDVKTIERKDTDVPCEARLNDLEGALDEAYALYDQKDADFRALEIEYGKITMMYEALREKQRGLDRKAK